MSKIDDGGMAFPLDGKYDGMMTLRDWFAGQALAGLYACRELQLAALHDAGGAGTHGGFEPTMAAAAYECADAMIAERQKEKP